MCVVMIQSSYECLWEVTLCEQISGCGQGLCYFLCCILSPHGSGPQVVSSPPPGRTSVRRGPSTTWTRGPGTTTSSQGSLTLESIRQAGWMLGISAALCAWTWSPWRPRRRTWWWRGWCWSTRWTPSGALGDCATSTGALLLTSSPSMCMAGSGQAQGQGWVLLIRHSQAGGRTPGHTQASSHSLPPTLFLSQTMLSTSYRGQGSPWRLVWQCRTTGTMTGWSGMTPPATGPSSSCARTRTRWSTGSGRIILTLSSNIYNIKPSNILVIKKWSWPSHWSNI